MYMIEIDEDRISNLSECVEKSLKYMGKVMQCLSEMEDSESFERGHRSHRDYEDEREYRGSGRYSRY